MTVEHGHARRRETAEDDRRFRAFDWYFRSRFDLMERFLEDLERPAASYDVPELRRRFLQTVHHAKRVLLARAFVTFLLALGVVATVVASLAQVVSLAGPLESGVAATSTFLKQAAAVTGSVSLLLLGLRLAFDRYLHLVDTCATFLGMQIAASNAKRANPAT